MPNRLSITDRERRSIEVLWTGISSRYRSAEDDQFLADAAVIAHDLPLRIRQFINDFRGRERWGICVISGCLIDDSKIGATPPHWNRVSESSPALQEEFLLVLLGTLLGDVFGWATQQDGKIIHEVLPIKEYENAQLGTSSNETLWWHSEDAFHPYRGDYLGLLCLRNPDRVPTTFASIDMLQLSKDQIEVLRQERFLILPDESHRQRSASEKLPQATSPDSLRESAYERIDRMKDSPQRISLLFGDPESPYIRLDAVYMKTIGEDEEANAALRELVRAINRNLQELILEPGDYCFIDNYRAVHGRRPFRAKYDGTDRWLKRINITRDLRKSRTLRSSCSSRIIN